MILDYGEMAQAVQAQLEACGKVLLATDRSVVDSVAAWAVALHEGADFCLGLAAEDQSPHRAEVEGLMAVVRALSRCSAHGFVDVLADCKSAIVVAEGGGGGLWGRDFVQLRAGLCHSARQLCLRAREAALSWERQALAALGRVAHRWAETEAVDA